ncbi:MAG: hypothetical protein KAW47_09335 [Thermoplasmatales archaeon]|nr:hypothetical protein [Thermoplasmatales archaeon]
MYALLTMFTLGPGMRSTMEKLVDEFAPVHRNMKGFKSMTFFGDDTVGECGALSIWESKEEAEDVLKTTGPGLRQAVSSIVKGQPTRRVFEVLEPKV